MLETARLTPVDPNYLKSLRDHVHDALRRAIIGGRFPCGEKLNERQLATELGVSTTPLKEALRRLEAEGLIRTEARRGVFVTFSARQAEEMTLARAAIESMIAREAAKHAGAKDLAALAALIEEMREATAAAEIERLVAINERFHDRIHEASTCRYLARLQDGQRMYDHATRLALHGEAAERKRALAEHEAIFKAIADHDQDRAERAMRDHIVRSGQRHIERVFGTPSDGGMR